MSRATVSALAVVAAAALPLALPRLASADDPVDPAKDGRRRVLITAFEPFEGRDVNNSTRIAQFIKASPELTPDIEITVCLLPVEYDRASDVALACYNKMGSPAPDAVISLGEVGCTINLETFATNLDNVPGGPDNAGVVRSEWVTIPGAPERLGYDIPAQAMYCALTPEERKLVRISTRMNYVCNNTANILANRLRDTGTRFGFIHVPVGAEWCGEREAPGPNAKVIAHMIEGMFSSDATKRSEAYPLPHCDNSYSLPTNLAELALVGDTIEAAGDLSECEIEYMSALTEAMLR